MWNNAITGYDIIYRFIMPFISAFLGAYLAFTYQKRTNRRKDKRDVLVTLMGNRHLAHEEPAFTVALNMVDVVFHDSKEVKEKLRKYLDYTSFEIYAGGQRVESFFSLLLAMAKDIGYNSLTESDIKDFYVPAKKDVPYQNQIEKG